MFVGRTGGVRLPVMALRTTRWTWLAIVGGALAVPTAARAQGEPAPAAPPAQPPAVPAPAAPAPAAPPVPAPVVPPVPPAPEPAPADEKPAEPFAFGDFTWLNGASRQ